jgi:hypothetical protein
MNNARLIKSSDNGGMTMQFKHHTRRSASRTNARDLAAGIFLTATAIVGLFLNREYTLGSAAQMGPGYMPMLVFSLLGFLGIIIIIGALRDAPDPLGRWAWRELVLILGAMASFGVLLEEVGLALSVATAVVISSLADRSQTIKGIVVLTVSLVAICWLIFIYGLGLNVSFLPPALMEG